MQGNTELFTACKMYMQKFMRALEERVKLESQTLVCEEQVLEYLQENQDIAKKLQAIFDYELQDIRRVRPDIINSWQYYLRFQDMVKTIDK
ncbi:DUF2972 domain-containing protein [Helicobacter aurati]|uniref:DUF2972 domain-containing protein n=1 Tax=Helicobacter aurati TaxID=137778 RepID=UPI000CF0516F|nr:DUF2972 domain-containing protein [Helicobacter aurati]